MKGGVSAAFSIINIMHKFHCFTALMASMAIAMAMQAAVTVTDASDGSSLVGVSVFDATGKLAELTDVDGHFEPVDAWFPVTLRSLGYKEIILDRPIDSVAMQPQSYPLESIDVSAAGRDVVCLTCYAREYGGAVAGNDSLSLLGEYMIDFFIPRDGNKKFKGKKRLTARRSVLRHTRGSEIDTVMTEGDMINMLSWLPIAPLPPGAVNEPEEWKVISGPVSDTVPGKSGFEKIMRRTPAGFRMTADYLARTKDHRVSPWMLKLIGCTIDFNEMWSNLVYGPGHDGEYRPEDLKVMTFSMRALGRGKWIKKAFEMNNPVDMRSYIELYVTDRRFLPTDEAKAMLNEPASHGELAVPDGVPPLDAAAAEMLDRADRQSGKIQQ